MKGLFLLGQTGISPEPGSPLAAKDSAHTKGTPLMNENVFTLEQFTRLRNLAAAHKVTPARFREILESGIFSLIFDPEADLSDRAALRKVLGLDKQFGSAFVSAKRLSRNESW